MKNYKRTLVRKEWLSEKWWEMETCVQVSEKRIERIIKIEKKWKGKGGVIENWRSNWEEEKYHNKREKERTRAINRNESGEEILVLYEIIYIIKRIKY